MRLLLDTHAFLWWIEGGERLSTRASRAIKDPANECLLSLASAWEIAIKVSLGKITIDTPLERFLPEQIGTNRFGVLAVDMRHIVRVGALPFHHRDPFDRLLVAQALEEDLPIVTSDTMFRRYGVRRVW